MNNNDVDLGFLGETYQYKLVHEFMADKDFFCNLNPIIEQNKFTDPHLRIFVGLLKEYYEKNDIHPTYDVMEMLLRDKAYNDIQREEYIAIVDKIKNTPSEGSKFVQDRAVKFFRQQQMLITAREIEKLASDGKVDNYDKIYELFSKSMTLGVPTDMGYGVFDNLNETLSDDYRITIPTGIDNIDDVLEGGIAKGELGVIIGPSSFGKVQPYHSRIFTPYGRKLMGDIKVGDEVLGEDGRPHKVTNVFPHKNWKFYKVTFSDGSYTECGKEHLWSVSENDGDDKVMSLEDILDKGIYKDDKPVFSIPITAPVEFYPMNFPVKPYEMGLYLANEEDRVLKDVGKFKATGIRYEYLYNILPVRISLLNGMMDGGGYTDEKGNTWFTTRHKELLNDFEILVNSLGGIVSYNRDENDIYKVLIKIYSKDVKIFGIKEKQDKVVYPTPNDCRRYITSVSPSCVCDGQCIMVDSESHLYLTDNFIVTHNTSMTTAIAGFAAANGYKVLQIVFEDRVKQIQRKHIARIMNVEAKDLSKTEYIDGVREQLSHYKEDFPELEKNLRINRFPSGEKTAWDIERYIKKQVNNGFRPDLVIVDYFECLEHKGDVNNQSEWEKEGKTMRKFEAMAGELDMAFWIPLQGTKDSVNADLVTMDKAGGSFKKIQVAHVVMSIARTIEDIEDNKATIAILKNRAGKAGKVFDGIEFNNGTCRISCDNASVVDSISQWDKEKQVKKQDFASNIAKQVFENKH